MFCLRRFPYVALFLCLFPTHAFANPLLNLFLQRAGREAQAPDQSRTEEQRLDRRRREMVSRVENAKQRETARRESWQREALWFRKVIADNQLPQNTWIWRESARTLRLRLEIVRLCDDSTHILDKLPSALISRDQSMTLLLQALEAHLGFLHRQRKPQPELDTPQGFLALKKTRKRIQFRLRKTLQTLQKNFEEIKEIQTESETNQAALDLSKRILLNLPAQHETHPLYKLPTSKPTTNPLSKTLQRSRLHRRLLSTLQRMRFEKHRLQAELLELRLEDENLEREALRLRAETYRKMLKLLDTSIRRLSRVVEGGLFFVKKISFTTKELDRTQKKLRTFFNQAPDTPSSFRKQFIKRWTHQTQRWKAGLPILLFLAALAWFALLWLLQLPTRRWLDRLQTITQTSETLESWRFTGILSLTLLLRLRWLLFFWGVLLFLFWTLEVSSLWLETTFLFGALLVMLRTVWWLTRAFFGADAKARWAVNIDDNAANRFRNRLRLLALWTALYFVANHLLRQAEFPHVWTEILFLFYLCFNQVLVLTLLSHREAVINLLPRNRFFDRVAIVFFYRLYPLFYGGAIVLFLSYLWGYRNLVFFLTWGVLGTIAVFFIHHSVFWLLNEAIQYALRIDFDETNPSAEKKHPLRIGHLLRMLASLLLTVSFLSFSLAAWSVPGGLLAIPSLLSFPLVEYQDRVVTFLSLGYFAIALCIGIWFSRLIPRLLRTYLYPVLTLSEGAQFASSAITSYIIVFLGILVGLQFLGLGTAGALLLFLVLGIGLGFGLQGLASNFASGLIILFGRPFSVGDHIEVGEHFGEVTEISARSTTIKLPNRRLLILPNEALLNQKLINWSAASAFRDKLIVEVAHGTDPHVVHDLLIKIAKEHKEVGAQPAPVVRLRELASNAMIFSLSVTLPKPSTRFRIRSEIRMEISKRFRALGIELALPKREISLESSLKQQILDALHPLSPNQPPTDPQATAPSESPSTPEATPPNQSP